MKRLLVLAAALPALAQVELPVTFGVLQKTIAAQVLENPRLSEVEAASDGMRGIYARAVCKQMAATIPAYFAPASPTASPSTIYPCIQRSARTPTRL